MIGNQNDSKMLGYQNDSKMIGFQNNRNGKMTTMINKVNTMTPRQNDLVVKKQRWLGMSLCKHKNPSNEIRLCEWNELYSRELHT